MGKLFDISPDEFENLPFVGCYMLKFICKNMQGVMTLPVELWRVIFNFAYDKRVKIKRFYSDRKEIRDIIVYDNLSACRLFQVNIEQQMLHQLTYVKDIKCWTLRRTVCYTRKRNHETDILPREFRYLKRQIDWPKDGLTRKHIPRLTRKSDGKIVYDALMECCRLPVFIIIFGFIIAYFI